VQKTLQRATEEIGQHRRKQAAKAS